jgi:hypothetical protein
MDELKNLRETPPPRLADEVMRQIAARPLPRRSWWRRLTAERTVSLRVRPLQLAAGMAFACALVSFLALRPFAPPPPVARVVTSSSTVMVRFSLAAPDARAVFVAGDFNGWRPEATPLERGPDGFWKALVPLSPGRWSYSFVVDGKWLEDPLAEAFREDGFGGRNATVDVGG